MQYKVFNSYPESTILSDYVLAKEYFEIVRRKDAVLRTYGDTVSVTHLDVVPDEL